ncbi:MAG: membrane protein insertase YidC, partial [Thermodesulfobacteriota bacterium]
MDNRLNWIIFLVLAFAIMIGQAYFFGEKPKEATKQTQTTQGGTESFPTEPSGSSDQFANFDEPIESLQESSSAPKGTLVTIDTPLYRGVIDTAGARIVSWELKDYKATQNGEGSELVNLFNQAHPGFNTTFFVKDRQIPQFIPYQYSGETNISLTEGTKELSFVWNSPQGITIRNVITLDSTTYIVKQNFEITNSTGSPLQERVVIRWLGPVQGGGMTSGVDTNTFIALVADEVERVNSSPDKSESFKGVINWFGFSEKYFTSLFLPETGAETQIEITPGQSEGQVLARFAYPPSTIQSGKTNLKTWEVFMGPLEPSLLKQVGSELDRAINYGWFGFLARPMLQFLEWLNTYFHNYGISIIVITIIIRVLFFPLTVKSMISMKKMALKTEKLKPEMDAIKEKYKEDKTKQNTELMALYSKHGINPLSQLGGCMPLLIQFP